MPRGFVPEWSGHSNGLRSDGPTIPLSGNATLQLVRRAVGSSAVLGRIVYAELDSSNEPQSGGPPSPIIRWITNAVIFNASDTISVV